MNNNLIDKIRETIDDVSAVVCDELCKYRSTCNDDDFRCDYIREHGECPLDRLQ